MPKGARASREEPPRRPRCVLLVLLALVLVSSLILGLWPRIRPFVRHRGEALSPEPVVSQGPYAGFRLEPAFGQRFERPVFVCQAPSGSDFYVVEQGGRVWRLPLGAARGRVFLDLTARVLRTGNEQGLLGLAFHPRYPHRPWVFVSYTAKEARAGLSPGHTVVARIAVDADGRPRSEEERVVLALEQPYPNHNGGMIAFGPDGCLYVGLGDGGWAGDLDDQALNPGTLLGSILRLDVDRAPPGAGYRVPSDNPLVGRPGARGEVWAYGFRNPWRFSFDRESGALWVGDVGQNAWEEVDRVEAGRCYGWSGFEGFEVYHPARAVRARDAVPPVAAYGRGEGICITGGYVYRGARYPILRGRYLYADFGSGAVWALVPAGQAPTNDPRRHRTAPGTVAVKLLTGTAIASFGEDRAGELYLASFDGTVYRLVR